MKAQQLNKICEYRKEKILISEVNLENYISTENLLPNKEGVIKASGLPNTKRTQAYFKGDVLVSNIRPYFKKIWLAKENGGCSNDVLVFKAKPEIDSGFLYYILSDDKFFEYSTASSRGTKMPRGDKKAIMEYEVPRMEYTAQKKIVDILGSIDKKIEVNNQINRNLFCVA